MINLTKTELNAVIAETLDLSVDSISDTLSYQSIPAWDSLKHVNLVLNLEKKFDTKIEKEDVMRLTNIRAIHNYFLNIDEPKIEVPTLKEIPEISRGLNGVQYDESKITFIDGYNGKLLHCGYSINDLSRYTSFEEMIYLLIHHELPNQNQLAELKTILSQEAILSEGMMSLIKSLKDVGPLEALRTCISYFGAFKKQKFSKDKSMLLREGLGLIAKVPLMIAAHNAFRTGKNWVSPNSQLGFSENFLYMLTGQEHSSEINKIFDSDMVVHADHGSNASAFVARVVTSTEADIFSAITAAIATFSGNLHGGALGLVMDMLFEISSPEQAQNYVKKRLDDGLPVYGFGHRVYRTKDPRAKQLYMLAMRMSEIQQDGKWLDILRNVEIAMQEYAEHGIAVNVDFYACILYHLLGIPKDLFVPIFVASRMAGWVAQIIEQADNNILIRPRLKYVGASERKYQIQK